MVLWNLTKQVVLAHQVRLACTFKERFKGWMGKQKLEDGEALLLYPCKGIHTWFLRFPLDILFLSKEGKVLLALKNFPPFRFSPWVLSSQAVVELPAGRILATNTSVGDKLVLYGREKSHDL
ncbi:hypothetical protein SAMN00808754_1127 [Thermanaeromonas toyohensis ToBE]|uniref:DUF192 domain-containing protein n=1 Tax=Thermanaeromonas toyohensis ToBE TaxID=698762 RepID=A0A1W1VPN2_9FIRM|nr:DUF192 domain-containing protein [Thermanaeromonas toyohensis]SMB94864.1 hypothetical protein SAMN00808754_1127 [Thermanaeromonas toyohensis ToBE]